MSKFSVEIVQRSGIDVEKLLDMLISNAAAELSAYFHYNILRLNLNGPNTEGLKEIIEVAKQEDLNHFEALIPRIYELGGHIPDNLVEFYNMAFCSPATLPKDKNDINSTLEVLIHSERCSLNGYNMICDMTSGKDFRTFDLSLAILNEETEHESWFCEFLSEGPSGNFMRRKQKSPFVSKFLR